MRLFGEWVHQELKRRRWNQSDLARRMGRDPGTVGNVLNGMRGAGPDFCIALARALRVPREEVFRARGWLVQSSSSMSATKLPRPLEELVEEVQQLPPPVQDELFSLWAQSLQMVTVLLKQKEER